MKKYASATLRKGKTDKLDSIRIANYGIDHWYKLVEYILPEDVYEQLRLLGRQYSYYIKLRIESKLAISNLLDRTMPGIKNLLSSKRSDVPTKDKLCDFIEEYWHFVIQNQLNSADRSNHMTKQRNDKLVFVLSAN